MLSGMEVLCPSVSYAPNSRFYMDQSRRNLGNYWTHEENKRFENALAEIEERTPDRWEKVASMIPGKTAEDVKQHYQELEVDVSHIEAGLFPPAGSGHPQLTLDWWNSRAMDELNQYSVPGGRRSASRPSDQERKKGIPWTEDEHKRFLKGLKKYGKGDWRNISRNFVISRTPTQVASHAQKYFIRLSSGSKDKRRSSIHDITTANMSDAGPPSPPQLSPISVFSSSDVGSLSSEQFSVSVGSNRPNESSGTYNPRSAVSQVCGGTLIQPIYDMSPWDEIGSSKYSYRHSA